MTNQTATDRDACAVNWWEGNGLVDAKNCGILDDFGVSLLGSKASFGIGNPDVSIMSTKKINDDMWHQVAATRSRKTGEIKLYVDGVLEGYAYASQNPLTSPSWIGFGNNPCNIENNKRWFNGYVYDLKIYDKVLGARYIRDMYTASKDNLPYDL